MTHLAALCRLWLRSVMVRQWRVHPELGGGYWEHPRKAGYVTAERPARALQRALAVQFVRVT